MCRPQYRIHYISVDYYARYLNKEQKEMQANVRQATEAINIRQQRQAYGGIQNNNYEIRTT